ncbi:hypothetical protein GCM10027056_05070 [Glaciibacter psychrotolerans]
MSAQTSEPSGLPFWTMSMTWLTSSGWARLAAAPSTLSTVTKASTFLCSSRYGKRWLNFARGPVSGPERRPNRDRPPGRGVSTDAAAAADVEGDVAGVLVEVLTE